MWNAGASNDVGPTNEHSLPISWPKSPLFVEFNHPVGGSGQSDDKSSAGDIVQYGPSGKLLKRIVRVGDVKASWFVVLGTCCLHFGSGNRVTTKCKKANWLVFRMPSVKGPDRGRRKHRVDYHQIIDWLVRKPGAFENYRYRDELFPTSRFRMVFDVLQEKLGRPKAARSI
jgi:hypothetical protein